MNTLQAKKSFYPKEQLGVGCVDIGPLEKRYVMDVLNKQRLSYGPYSSAFEKEFGKGVTTRNWNTVLKLL